MKSINEVTLLGRIGQNLELKYTRKGTPVVDFSVALNEKWNDEDGKPQERVTWVTVVAWSGLATACSEHLRQGSLVLVKGSIDVQTSDEKKYVKVKAADVIFLDPKPKT